MLFRSPFDFITDSRPEYRMRLHVVRFQIAEGVYENIYTKAKKIADDRTYDLLSNNEDVDDVEIWDFVPLADFQPIILNGKNWSTFFEDILIRPEETKIAGGKEE